MPDMADKEKDISVAWVAWLENKQLQHTEQYVRRGRRFAGTPTHELKEQWILAFKYWASDLRQVEPGRNLREDLESELAMRKEKLPFDAVKTEMDQLKSAVKAAAKHLEADPKRFEEFDRELQSDLDDFERSTKRRPGH